MRILRRLVPCLILMLILGVASEALACPNCKEAVASQDGGSMRLADGYSWSIILMIAMPFTLLGAGSMMIIRAVKSGAFPEM